MFYAGANVFISVSDKSRDSLKTRRVFQARATLLPVQMTLGKPRIRLTLRYLCLCLILAPEQLYSAKPLSHFSLSQTPQRPKMKNLITLLPKCKDKPIENGWLP